MTRSKNQREFPSIPRWNTWLSSETRRPLVSCGNERQRQARLRELVLEGTRSREREAEIEEGGIEEKGRKIEQMGVKKEGKHERILRETKRNVKIQKKKTKWEKRGNFKRRRKKDKNR